MYMLVASATTSDANSRFCPNAGGSRVWIYLFCTKHFLLVENESVPYYFTCKVGNESNKLSVLLQKIISFSTKPLVFYYYREQPKGGHFSWKLPEWFWAGGFQSKTTRLVTSRVVFELHINYISWLACIWRNGLHAKGAAARCDQELPCTYTLFDRRWVGTVCLQIFII